jgi:hypothetical protein
MNPITLRKIKAKLERLYWGELNSGRRLIITPIENSYGNVGSYLFSLEGSPPKGYALYVPAHHKILFVNAWLDKTRLSKDFDMEGME